MHVPECGLSMKLLLEDGNEIWLTVPHNLDSFRLLRRSGFGLETDKVKVHVTSDSL